MNENMRTTIIVHARFTVDERKREPFEALLAELTTRAEAEEGTLTYRAFRGGEPGAYAVIEEYADASSAQAHQQANQDLLAQVDECTTDVWMDLHGPVGSQIREWAQSLPRVVLYQNPV